jgi:hypothetical protein
MLKVPSSVLVAMVAGLCVLASPVVVDTAESEFSTFLSMHDLLHPSDLEKREPHRIYIRKTFWDNDNRILRVDAGTNQGKGALVIVEGLPGSEWLTAFSISGVDGASFKLPVPEKEAVPCKVVVRSGTAVSISVVENSPTACDRPDASGALVMASL